jgi:hypothetical protein
MAMVSLRSRSTLVANSASGPKYHLFMDLAAVDPTLGQVGVVVFGLGQDVAAGNQVADIG